MNDSQIKFASAAGLYALWAILVFVLKLDPSDLVGSIKYALGGLGVYHLVTNLQSGQQQTLPAALLQLLGQPQKPGIPTVPLDKGPQ